MGLNMYNPIQTKCSLGLQSANTPKCQHPKVPTSQSANKPTSQSANKPKRQQANKPTSQSANKPKRQQANMPKKDQRPKTNTQNSIPITPALTLKFMKKVPKFY